MKKKHEDVFQKDIEIPDIVQQKTMEAFSKIQKEGKTKMSKKSMGFKRVIKPIVAVAACVVIVACINFSDIIVPKSDGNQKTTNVAQSQSNPFTLSVHAAESRRKMSEGKAVVVASNAGGWAIGSDADYKNINYSIDMPLTCEGENIDKITYSVNKGAIQRVQRDKGVEIIITGEDVDNLNVGMVAPDGEEGELNSKFYKSIDVDYDKQNDKDTCLNICNDKVQISNGKAMFDHYSVEEELKAFQEMLDGVKIKCTVTFMDGSTSVKVIDVGAKLMTAKEAGFEKEEVEKTETSDRKDVYVVFELEK